MAWDGIDLKVQPQEPVVLKGVENTDWRLLRGDTDVRVEVRHWVALGPPPQLSRAPSWGHRPNCGPRRDGVDKSRGSI